MNDTLRHYQRPCIFGGCTLDLTVTLIQVFAENRGDSGSIFLHGLHFVRCLIPEEGQGEIPIFRHCDRMPKETREAGLFWLVVSKVLVHGHLPLLFLGTASWQGAHVDHSGSLHCRQEAERGTREGQGQSCAHSKLLPPN